MTSVISQLLIKCSLNVVPSLYRLACCNFYFESTYSGITVKFAVFAQFRYLTFHDGGPYHKETSSLIANQWTGFHMIGTSVTRELKLH